MDGHGNDGRRTTVRQILQQTSGLYDPIGELPALQSADGFRAHHLDHVTAAQLVSMAMRHRPQFAAGTQWSYSNTNYLVAGMLIERVTHQSWSAEVRSRILVPLHLTRTFYPGDLPTLPQPHAEVYQQFAPTGPLVDTTVFNPTVAGSAGGLVSTTDDLSHFWQALVRGRLLRPGQQAEMEQTVPAEVAPDDRPGAGYGLGIMWIPNRCGGYWAHFGDMPGVTTVNAISPDARRSTVVYLATALADPAPAATVMRRTTALLDDLMCD